MKKSNTILKKIITLQNPKENYILLIYSVLRLCFTFWLTYIIIKGLYSSLLKILFDQTVKWYDYLPIAFIVFIIYKTLKPIILKKRL